MVNAAQPWSRTAAAGYVLLTLLLQAVLLAYDCSAQCNGILLLLLLPPHREQSSYHIINSNCTLQWQQTAFGQLLAWLVTARWIFPWQQVQQLLLAPLSSVSHSVVTACVGVVQAALLAGQLVLPAPAGVLL